MQFSFLLACAMAVGTWAAPIAYLQVGREPSGRLAIKSVIRRDDVLDRDTLSQTRHGHIERIPVQTV